MNLQRLFRLLHDLPEAEAEAAARRFGANGPALAVSGCLAGIPCRYDATHRLLTDLDERLEGRLALPLCPEVLAGLGTPRPTMEFMSGDGAQAMAGRAVLVDEADRDCTEALLEAAVRAVRLARAAGCTEALLKARSPSCGVHMVHTRLGLVAGSGIFTAACREAGIRARSDEDLPWT